MSVTGKSERQQQNEVYVLRTAKDLAKSHISDVIESTVLALRSANFLISAGHDGRMTTPGAKAMGEDVANAVLHSLLDTAPIDYREMVAEANEDDDVIDEDTLQDDLRKYVDGLLQEWA